MLKIVLASQSPRRKKLMSLLGIDFKVIPSNCEEIIRSSDPQEVVKDLSFQKADEVSKRVDNSVVIGADTIVVLNKKILGKPNSKEDAVKMLNMLSGQTHSVFTGVTLIHKESGKIVLSYTFSEETKVTFSSLNSDEIEAYIETGSPMDKAGSYGIQDDWGAVFVERIDGDFYNVVGFPLNRFYREVKKLIPIFFSVKEAVN